MIAKQRSPLNYIVITSLTVLLLAITLVAVILSYFTSNTYHIAALNISLDSNDSYHTTFNLNNISNQFVDVPITITPTSQETNIIRAQITLLNSNKNLIDPVNLSLPNWEKFDDFYYYNGLALNNQNIFLNTSFTNPTNKEDDLYLSIYIETISTSNITNNSSWYEATKELEILK